MGETRIAFKRNIWYDIRQKKEKTSALAGKTPASRKAFKEISNP